jgi:thiosulfate/3-mercaptopyruvate sulfurtransferase
LLTSAAELADHLGESDWVVVDCRFNLGQPDAGEASYRAGHIPGAHYAHLDRDLASPPTPQSGRHPLPDIERLAGLFNDWGIGPDTQVVVYDDVGGAIAARLWWLLRWLGHDRVALLDGGLPAWQAAGLPLAAEVPTRRRGAFAARPGRMPVAETEELRRRLADPKLLIVDARAAKRFLGREEPIDPVAGHVPGAINAPFTDNLTADGKFRSPADLRERFAGLLGDRPPDAVVSMCGSGVTACHNLLALELAGFRGARLYVGSWSEWIRSADRPVARA